MLSTGQAQAGIGTRMSKTFDAAATLSSRASAADEGAIIRMSQRTRALRAKGQDVVALTLGEPDFDTPEHIRDAAKLALDRGHTHYAPVAGIPALREAISRKLQRENGLDYPATSIVLANGVKQAMNNAILSVIGPGDEAIIMAPYWVSYEASIRFAGGIPVVLQSSVSENYKAPAARIAAAMTVKTKLLIINSPCNPTGAVWSRVELEAIAAEVRKHPALLVMADEIYEYILFEGDLTSFGTLPGMLERTITLNGFSKGFAMTGWRLGYAAAPEPIAVAMTRMQSIISAGANAFVQHAAIAALDGSRDDVVLMREAYRKRRDMVVTALRGIAGVKIVDIPATFYAFPDVGAFLGRRSGNHVINTVDDLCDWLLDAHGVATVPGTAFGAEHAIRLSFATGEAELKEALARIAKGLSALV
jgi:aspartate aminotransferase